MRQPGARAAPVPQTGGERGIRTPGPLRVNGFQDRRDRPLRHLSGRCAETPAMLPRFRLLDNILDPPSNASDPSPIFMPLPCRRKSVMTGFSPVFSFQPWFHFITQRRKGDGGAEFMTISSRHPDQGGSAAAEIPERYSDIPTSRNSGTFFLQSSGASLPAFSGRGVSTKRPRIGKDRRGSGRIEGLACAWVLKFLLTSLFRIGG